MKDFQNMAMLVSDTDCASAKVWQPWYIDESDGVRKALPTRLMRETRARDRRIIHKPPRKAHSPGAGSDEELDVGQYEVHGPAVYASVPVYAYADPYYDEDVPLDMSIKRKSPAHARAPTPPTAHVATHAHTPPPLQPPPAHAPTRSPPPYSAWAARDRPTVITCAPPWYLPPTVACPPPPYALAAHATHRDLAVEETHGHRPPRPPSSDRCDRRSPLHRTPVPKESSEVRQPDPPKDSTPNSRRHVLQAGPIDPEIDEHFRRSLGINYQKYFVSENSANQQNQSNDSVDDHFAKSLGATWAKVKAEREKESPSVSAASVTIQRISPSSPHHSAPSPLHHVSSLLTAAPSHSRLPSTPPSLIPVPSRGGSSPVVSVSLATNTVAPPPSLRDPPPAPAYPKIGSPRDPYPKIASPRAPALTYPKISSPRDTYPEDGSSRENSLRIHSPKAYQIPRDSQLPRYNLLSVVESGNSQNPPQPHSSSLPQQKTSS